MLSQYIFLHNTAGAKNDSIGIKELTERSAAPQRVLLPEKISEVHTNDHVALFYSKMTNTLYACGLSVPGYTAGGPPVKLQLKNQDSQTITSPIKQIAIWKNCVILTEDGDIFSDIESNGNIRLFSKEMKFSCICAGYGNAYAVDSSSGQVVRLAGGNRVDRLTKNNTLQNDPVVSMCSGYDQVISVTNDGNAYGFGYGHHGELGTGAAAQYNTWTGCALNNTTTRIKEASSGLFHAVFLPRNEPDCVYVAGRNSEGQLGMDIVYKVLEVTKVHVPFVKKLVATTYSTFFLTSKGDMLECGQMYSRSGNKKDLASFFGNMGTQTGNMIQDGINSGRLQVTSVSPYSFNNMSVLVEEKGTMNKYMISQLERHLGNNIYADLMLIVQSTL